MNENDKALEVLASEILNSVKNICSKLHFDRTYIGIISSINEDGYTVKYDGTDIRIKATKTNFYAIGDVVKFCIPCGNKRKAYLVENLIDASNKLHPVGSIYITSTNTNPASTLGGTWTLISKEFISTYNTNADLFTKTDNVSSYSIGNVKVGNTIRFKLGVTTAVDISDTKVSIGTINIEKCGLTTLTYALRDYPGGSDNGNAVALIDVNDTTGEVSIVDVIGATPIKSGSTIYFDFTIVARALVMLDGFCDKFYWKRKA